MIIRGVAFDIDGTLYSNPRFYLHSLVHGLRNLRLMRHFRAVRKTIRRIRPVADFHALQRSMLAVSMSISESRADRLIAERFYRKSEDLLTSVPLFPEVRSTLRSLRKLGIRLAAASDFPVERKLRLLGLTDAFDCAYSTEDTGYLKPNPEAFAPLSECLDLPPSEILYVGNSYHYDVIGASEAGFRTAHITRVSMRDSAADLSFFRYATLLQWIRDRVPRETRIP